MRKKLFAGIDPSASSSRASGFCILDDSGNIVSLGKWYYFEELAEILHPFGEKIQSVGIDGPLQLPLGLHPCCFAGESCDHRQQRIEKGRICERILIRRGFSCFLTTRNSFVKSWVLRCLELGRFLSGCSYQVIEVFPYAARKILFPELTGSKQKREFRQKLQTALLAAGYRLPDEGRIYTHDELDAVLAAVTARLADSGKAEKIGEKEDGFIYIPCSEIIS